MAVAALPDGRRALSASADKTLKLWDLETGNRQKPPRKDTVPPSRRTWAEGLRPIPSSQPKNKNSPRQLESEAGLSHVIPRRFRILGAAALPQSENHVGQQQCVAFILRHTIFHKRGFSQINVTTRRRSTSSTGASRELRAMGYRTLSACPPSRPGRGGD